MKRSIGRRLFGATRALLVPVIILWMIIFVWLGMVWAELRGE